MEPEHLNRKWGIFGGPKMVYDTIYSREKELEKKKNAFSKEMEEEQKNFREQIDDLESEINGFYQNNQESSHAVFND